MNFKQVQMLRNLIQGNIDHNLPRNGIKQYFINSDRTDITFTNSMICFEMINKGRESLLGTSTKSNIRISDP